MTQLFLIGFAVAMLGAFFFMSQLRAEEMEGESKNTFMMPENPVVVLDTNEGVIEIRLFPKVAPKAVENFIRLSEKGYYNGLTFHRVIPGFMLQGGDPNGNGTGGQSIWGKNFGDEFDANVTFNKPLLLAMANRGPGTNGSQFFITVAATPWLNNKHTIFGEVVKGQDVVKKIESKGSASGQPSSKQIINKAYLKKS